MKLVDLYLLLLLSSLSALKTKAQGQTDNMPILLETLRPLLSMFEPCSSRASLPNISTSSFYIRLENRTVESMLDTSGFSNEKCPVSGNESAGLGSMCGCDFLNRQARISNILNLTTCPSYSKIQDRDSPLGICEEVLNSLGYCTTLVPYSSANTSGGIDVYNVSHLQKTVSKIETYLKLFFDVVDRTIVGTYFRNPEQKCFCLDSYKKWLCATSLKLYISAENLTSFNKTKCCPGETLTVPSSTGPASTSETFFRFKPCLGICNRVVQTCPYYLPSSFQNDKSPGLAGLGENDTTELVYGGYPAFDCPRESVLMKSNSCNLGTYAHPDCDLCISNSGAISRTSLFTILLVSMLLCLLW